MWRGHHVYFFSVLPIKSICAPNSNAECVLDPARRGRGCPATVRHVTQHVLTYVISISDSPDVTSKRGMNRFGSKEQLLAWHRLNRMVSSPQPMPCRPWTGGGSVQSSPVRTGDRSGCTGLENSNLYWQILVYSERLLL